MNATDPPSKPHLPRPKRQRSLFGEILDWMLVPLLLVWPLSIGITFLVAQTVASKPFDRDLSHRVARIAYLVRADPRHVAGQLRILRDSDQRTDASPFIMQVRTVDGHVIGGDTTLPPLPWTGGRNPNVRLRDATVRGRSLRIASLWLPAEGGTPPMLIQAAETRAQRWQLARDIMRGVILPQFVIVPISILLVWFGLGQGIIPLDDLQARIRRRRPDDLSPIDQREAPEEIAPLVDSINGLLGRLEHSIHTQKRFIADAAHQLKTPLAGLRMQSELAQRETDPGQFQLHLRQIAISVNRTTRLVNQLLALARAENQGIAAQGSDRPIDLRQPVRDAVQDLAPLALGKGQELEFDAPDTPLWVRGNALLLQELTKNLLDNAIVYTPRGGSVAVRLRAVQNGAELAVEDSGLGIAPADRDLVFEPFYRVLGTGNDGSGLGLSIVQEIARQHGATIELEANSAYEGKDMPGLVVRVRFGTATPDSAPVLAPEPSRTALPP